MEHMVIYLMNNRYDIYLMSNRYQRDAYDMLTWCVCSLPLPNPEAKLGRVIEMKQVI